ncbi:hypothetical protein [Prochlorococcus sp. MIT 1307]|uniref:hypothetical protein n=1 Tax=Prochlorococcus sp. MIT 1307 TaxID=3096219 RepID=UPI002A762B66|nr:hypothetical protein [Prochlorococcus sp. MIT 1307]
MSESNSQRPSIEAFPIPEGSVLLGAINASGFREFTIAALKQVLKDRDLNLPLGPELDLENPERLISLNQFAVQIVVAGFTSDEITIPLKDWYQAGAAPQLLLAAQVDEENNVVFFRGVLTGPEFESLISKRLNNQQEINLSLDRFGGGIDRLLRFVRLLEPSAIPRVGLFEESSPEWNWAPIQKKMKAVISIAALGAGTILLGPELLRPRLSGSIASLTPSQIAVLGSTRSADGIATVCLLTPEVTQSRSSSLPIALVSVDRPLIFSLDPLNELKISKNGTIVLSKLASLNKRIEGPITWPIQSPIQPGETFDLSFRPKGTSPGSWTTIQIQTNPSTSFQKLDTLIDALGKKESRWINAINRELKKDKNLALTLLFSSNAPQTKALNKARTSVLVRDGCLETEN